ncbi:hypothetical protein HMPREF1121_01080 [Porphyromonas sp. KLE 1280]|jgi:hypothetical protein|uniref:hypothetical protein n=1 Tax=Porphyromonas sp. KLE 1280 TaxID=997829 RepID=UPI0004D754C3|nr:hypothetical protein [Porphyromonas sp. KLE 1280]KDU79223.1 hypothetical protein HMPREF1121_01080 [Porphyromonas sp. KLE 1280]
MESDKQKVKELSISRLVLWSENPRDPLPDRKIGRENDRIIRRAIEDVDKSWKLLSLLKTMGEMYDSSDLPIVVMKDGHPIVYDGNRRVILAMIKHNEKYLKLLPSSARRKLEGFDVDKKLYCDVCTEATALKLIIRKHADSGSWKPIQQGLFRMRYMGESPSILLQINSLTDGAIEKSKMLNQRFVEEEVFIKGHLESLGISVEGDSIKSAYTREELVSILRDIFKLIEERDISTRKRPALGKLPSSLSERSQALCSSKKDQPRVYTEKYVPIEPAPIEEGAREEKTVPQKRTRRVEEDETPLFGKVLCLRSGSVNNLYKEIEELDLLISKSIKKSEKNKSQRKGVTVNAHVVTRMALRLLCETALKDLGMNKLAEYLSEYFKEARKSLSGKERKFLSHNLSKVDPKAAHNHEQLLSLLQDSAHTYDESARNYKQTIAMSVLVGAILSCSHGKE